MSSKAGEKVTPALEASRIDGPQATRSEGPSCLVTTELPKKTRQRDNWCVRCVLAKLEDGSDEKCFRAERHPRKDTGNCYNCLVGMKTCIPLPEDVYFHKHRVMFDFKDGTPRDLCKYLHAVLDRAMKKKLKEAQPGAKKRKRAESDTESDDGAK